MLRTYTNAEQCEFEGLSEFWLSSCLTSLLTVVVFSLHKCMTVSGRDNCLPIFVIPLKVINFFWILLWYVTVPWTSRWNVGKGWCHVVWPCSHSNPGFGGLHCRPVCLQLCDLLRSFRRLNWGGDILLKDNNIHCQSHSQWDFPCSDSLECFLLDLKVKGGLVHGKKKVKLIGRAELPSAEILSSRCEQWLL